VSNASFQFYFTTRSARWLSKSSFTVYSTYSRNDGLNWRGFLQITHSIQVNFRPYTASTTLLGEFFANFKRKYCCTSLADRVSS